MYGTALDLRETDEWLERLRERGRKESTLRTHRNNIVQCLRALDEDGRRTRAEDISPEDVRYLWRAVSVKEEVKRSYLRSLAGMVRHFTGRDIVAEAGILYNRETRDRLFITKETFGTACRMADPQQRLILCLGACMGLRRAEMAGIRDGDIQGDRMHVRGDGKNAVMDIPGQVLSAIDAYRSSPLKQGGKSDDYLLQTRGRDGALHRINVSRISDCMKSLGDSIGTPLTTQSLRRLYATTLYIDADADLLTLKRAMRHSDIGTTVKCYVDASGDRASEAGSRLSSMLDEAVGVSRRLRCGPAPGRGPEPGNQGRPPA